MGRHPGIRPANRPPIPTAQPARDDASTGRGRRLWSTRGSEHPNRGVMTLPRLNIYRHDRGARALVTLAGVIDPVTAPRVRAALEQCLRDGITLIDVDLTTVDRCDDSGPARLPRRVGACRRGPGVPPAAPPLPADRTTAHGHGLRRSALPDEAGRGAPSAGLTSTEAPQGTGHRTESADAPVKPYAGRAPRRPVSPQDHARSRCR